MGKLAKLGTVDVGNALGEILKCDIPANATADGLTKLARLVSVAVGASSVAILDTSLPSERRILAETDLSDADRDRWARSNGEELRGLDGVDVRVMPGTRGSVHLVTAGGNEGTAAERTLVLDHAAARGGTALEVARLRGDLDRALAQILETDERLLGRIGLDIHDGPTQHLSVALLEIQLLEADLADAASNGVELPDGLLGSMERIYETLGGALTEMRELIGHLRPAQFEDRRLSDIMRDAISGFEGRTGTEVEAAFEGEFPINGVSVTQRITFYRILQEALNNAHRHGQARNITVEAVDADDQTILRVHDDGGGFDAEQALRPRTGAPIARFGLHGMRDRTQMLGGTFTVRSSAGDGTHLEVVLPQWLPEDGDGSGA
ncbi:MAG: sensor histidine kinase [Thermoleophilia bacterium]